MNAPARDALRAEAQRWLAYAAEDLTMVDLALQHTPALVFPAAFHAQQAAEKLVKALLILAETPFPKTHDIEALLTLFGPVPGMDDATRLALCELSPWAAGSRYLAAGDQLLPRTDDIRAARGLTDRLATLVQAAIDAP